MRASPSSRSARSAAAPATARDGLLARYQAEITDGGFSADPAQARAAEALQAVQRALADHPRPGLVRRLLGARIEPVTGLYMWGGVGRGKTWLMDLFFETLAEPRKGRWHFHRFMGGVHEELKTLKNRTDPLQSVADRIAARARVICFDEFFVSDIADAMILGRLFEALFGRGVTLVATSNIPPDELYRDGLQRARFLPAIALLKRHCRVLNVDNGIDYRLRTLETAEIYHAPLDEAAEINLADSFERLTGGHELEQKSLMVNGREIPVRRLGEDVAWFDFTALCDGPRAAADYIEIARCYHTVLLSGVPRFDYRQENQARRFISLVDEFYDRNVKLMLSAETELNELYAGERLRFEFERTRSRLIEMQSHDYLAREHRP